MPSITYILTTFVKSTLSKSIIFKVKNTFDSNVFKWVIKFIFINSSPFDLLIINFKIMFNFQKEWCTFARKKERLKKNKDGTLLKFKCLKHAITFLICVKL